MASLARLFVSSTFRDMQNERDILSRLVLPRLRSRFQGRIDDLVEIDLRWGITRAMSQGEAAARICLEEIDACAPLVVGMVAHRVGWQPDVDVLKTQFGDALQSVGPAASMTEIELRYAQAVAQAMGAETPPILLRTARLSQELGEALDEEEGAQPFRDYVEADGSAAVYDSLADFERLAEIRIANMLEAWLDFGAPERPFRERPVLERRKEEAAIASSGWRRRSKLVYGAPGVGLTSLAETHARSAGLEVVDGRNLGGRNLATAIGDKADGAATLPDAVSGFLSTDTKGLVIDHFEDSFDAEARATVNDLPLAPPRHRELVVVTHSPRLRDEAARLGWRVAEIGSIDPTEARSLAHGYLSHYSKHLSDEHAAILERASWLCDLKTLNLILDELRRHGAEETLGDRLTQLVAISDPVGVVEEIIGGLGAVMPTGWEAFPQRALIAIFLSLNGLSPRAICVAASATKEPAAPHLWTAVRISLEAGLGLRQGRVDLASRWFEIWLDRATQAEPEVVAEIGHRLVDWLTENDPAAAALNAPRIYSQILAPSEFANRLADRGFALRTERVGAEFLSGWLRWLGPELAEDVVQAWAAISPIDGEHDDAWRLGAAAVAAGVKAAAGDLLQIDARINPERSHRDVLLAWISDDPEPLQRLRRIGPGVETDEELMIAVVIVGAFVDGRLEATDQEKQDWISNASAYARSKGLTREESQLMRYKGQYELIGGYAKDAAKSFAEAEAMARGIGDAALLCRALERRAAALLEINKFRQATTAAEECRQEAALAGLHAEEHLAYERLIEAARRRSDWERAYKLVAEYRERCDAEIGEAERADGALAELERLS